MPRVVLCVWSLLAGLLPASVLALGLGEIDPKSALNEPFVADIPVVLSAGDDISQLQVSLASRETFERYGLSRPAFLSDFEFRIIADPVRPVVRVESPQPVIEPFVTLLLEVDWPQGRLLREFTVLLDPPVFTSTAPAASPRAPAAAPTEQQRPVARQEPQPAPAPTPRAAPMTGGSYAVQRNETLWGVAQRMRPDDSVDMNQMMLAIFRANPEAFAGNINQLKAGAILRAPAAGEVSQLSRTEAFAEVRRQNEAWRGSSRAPAETPRLRLVPPPAGADEAMADTGADVTRPPASGAEDSARVMQLEAELANRDRLLDLKYQ